MDAATISKIAVQVSDMILQYGLDLLGAVILLIAGWLFAGWSGRAVRRALDRAPRMDETLKPFLSTLVRYVVLTLVLVAVLAQFGVQTTSIIAVVGAAGLAVGLALQGTLANIAAGVMLLVLRPFGAGDYIDADGISGTVKEIGLFLTYLETPDGLYRTVPNSQIANKPITNYSRLPDRRIDLALGIGYGDDIDAAQSVLLSMMKEDGRIKPDPEPQVMVMALADSSVNLNLRCWVGRADYWPVLFDLTKNAKQRLDREGISIPFPRRDVHILSDAGS
jgi:small conductance mechanosensitive channel